MSYIQGTQVRLIADFTDNETGDPTDPAEVILTVVPPLPAVPFQRTLAAGQVQDDTEKVGRFYYILDTSLAAGTWSYQFESTGNEAVVGRKDLTVKARIPVVVP